jgi:hypothetical protein
MQILVLLLGGVVGSSMTVPPVPCSVEELRDSPNYVWPIRRVGERVDSAPRIARVVAVSADSRAHTVTFHALEWLKGRPVSADSVTLNGVAVTLDDFNRGPVPYQIVRSAGTRGSCFANEYRIGGEYLLLLQDTSRPNSLSLYPWALGPVNEQLRGDDDPWLAWVRERVRHLPRD